MSIKIQQHPSTDQHLGINTRVMETLMANNSPDAIYPLLFHPTFKDYVWGGRNLETKLHRKIPEGIVAESWEIAGHPNGSSVVKNGELAGMTLPQVQIQLGEALVGARNRYALAQERFPLLVKLLDANRWLSVQVHPADDYALEHEGEFGKTEMWVVLHAEPDSEIIFGFQPGVTKAAFEQALRANEPIDEMLHRLPVQAGDVVFVPAGAIHALGPGVIVAEIQQNSDTTYRIYDWGRPRPIHIDQALDVLDFSLVQPTVVTPKPLSKDGLRVESIGRCSYFHVERIYADAQQRYAGNCGGLTFEMWGLLSGQAQIRWQDKRIGISAIDWALLPAALGDYTIEATSDSTLLRIYTP